jgi:hypothetical protein
MYYSYIYNKNPNTDSLDTTQITQFISLMEKIMSDPDSDLTGKHILIRHSGPTYTTLSDALDFLEMNILVYMSSLLEGAYTGARA